jgi:cystathionine beta-lyase/cystathionine gamma-synthase
VAGLDCTPLYCFGVEAFTHASCHNKVTIKWQDSTAREIAQWMEGTQSNVVKSVWHLCLKSHQDHDTWSRIYTGAGPSFGFTLQDEFRSDESLALLMDQLCVVRIGAATGGEESCAWPHSVEIGGQELGNVIMYVGLEDPECIMGDLCDAFQHLRCQSTEVTSELDASRGRERERMREREVVTK